MSKMLKSRGSEELSEETSPQILCKYGSKPTETVLFYILKDVDSALNQIEKEAKPGFDKQRMRNRFIQYFTEIFEQNIIIQGEQASAAVSREMEPVDEELRNKVTKLDNDNDDLLKKLTSQRKKEPSQITSKLETEFKNRKTALDNCDVVSTTPSSNIRMPVFHDVEGSTTRSANGASCLEMIDELNEIKKRTKKLREMQKQQEAEEQGGDEENAEHDRAKNRRSSRRFSLQMRKPLLEDPSDDSFLSPVRVSPRKRRDQNQIRFDDAPQSTPIQQNRDEQLERATRSGRSYTPQSKNSEMKSSKSSVASSRPHQRAKGTPTKKTRAH